MSDGTGYQPAALAIGELALDLAHYAAALDGADVELADPDTSPAVQAVAAVDAMAGRLAGLRALLAARA